MEYKFFLVSAEDANDGTKVGYAYAKANKSKWVTPSKDVSAFLTVGYNIGTDFITYKGKAYFIKKSYLMIDEGTALIICVESVNGCEVREAF